MKKIAFTLISLLFLLTACQANDPNAIILDEVLASFEEQQLSLKESKATKNDNIFGMKLNGVRPSFYELDGKQVLVYIYNSNNQREKGLEDWRKKTASMDTVSYKVCEVNNVLLFYVYVDEYLNSETDSRIQNVVTGLSDS
ncbi:hypothetical protein [Sporosarcina aquimarina]|uniref:Lipoprotein n=1 Tax=Sporosarcina aquimarina TaxID=114975 RepID=A0ABU4FYG2_9BACL|nr:hypothetical protein [Sporosarcina aquimarina]MDW0109759.1 hypothetical protein [Sporosarcina aquimarina]